MNCNLCIAYLREKNKCPGCREMNKSNYCKKCIIKHCGILKKKKMKFCSDKCKKYPCKRLKNLDKRYRAKYGMSMIENLKFIEEKGIRRFIEQQKHKYLRKDKIYCVHSKKYMEIK
jgi:hypothetical protein